MVCFSCLVICSLNQFRGGYSENIYIRKINVRIKSLVIPYVFWNVFWLLYNFLKAYKLHGVADAELLNVESFGDIIACFWQKGFGAHPDHPIAGYTWFLRDLFVFALLSPMYNYCYKKKYFSVFILVVLLACCFGDNWHVPGFNTWIYIGGFVAYYGHSIDEICSKIRWNVLILLFLAINFLYYSFYNIELLHQILIILSCILVFKISRILTEKPIWLSLAASSTYLYVTHILVINISRHILVKYLNVNDDLSLSLYFIFNSMICVVICLASYYLLKYLKAERLLAILTGGRS